MEEQYIKAGNQSAQRATAAHIDYLMDPVSPVGAAWRNFKAHKYFLGFLVLAVIAVVFASWGKDALKALNLGETSEPKGVLFAETRACATGEIVCPDAGSGCLDALGNRAPPVAYDLQGNACCRFACGSALLPVRNCLDREVMCAQGQPCLMGTTIRAPNAITPGGRACCDFDCFRGDLMPTRTCFSSETPCPAGSLCLSYDGSTRSPQARQSDGSVCCQYAGSNVEGIEVCIS